MQPLTARQSTTLVTGGSGFVGRFVVRALAGRGHRVLATSTNIARPGLPDQAAWIAWDARQRLLPDVDFDAIGSIVHLAKPRQPFAFPESVDANFETSVAATFRLLEAARRAGVERFLLGSTGDVDINDALPGRDTGTPPTPDSFYSVCKACAELMTLSYARVMSTAVLRFYHPYGPGGDRFLVGKLMRAVRQQQVVFIEGEDGINVNPIWIEELAEGVASAAGSRESGVFCLAGPKTVSLRQLVETIAKATGQTPRIQTKAACPPAGHHVGDTTRARCELDFAPSVAPEEGMQRLVGLTEEALV